MFYISKGKEPKSLTKYKKTKGAYFDGFDKKDDIRQSLLNEQGYLCAYCMRRINSVDEVTIEHYYPQSKIEDKMGLDYKYMLGVCKLNRNCDYKNQTCDAHRGNESLTINPWSYSSISMISYNQRTGDIYSDNPQINKDLVTTLNLNCINVRLSLNRKAALDSLKNYIIKKHKEGLWSNSLLSKIRQQYSNKDKSGKYKPYIGILLWYINKKVNKDSENRNI